MSVRAATAADVEAIVDLAQATRIVRSGWEPELWPMAPGVAAGHPLVVRQQLGGGAVAVLVDEDGAAVTGYLVASVRIVGRASVWVVDELALAPGRDWSTTGRALLVAAAARARTAGAAAMAVAVAARDQELAAVVSGAGLGLAGWYRMRRLPAAPTAATATRIATADDAAALARLDRGRAAGWHSLESATGTGVVAEDHRGTLVGFARASAAVAPPSQYAPGGATVVIEPFTVADAVAWADAGERLLDATEGLAIGRGDRLAVVPVTATEGSLDALVERRDYRRVIDWWLLRGG